ncbi:DNA polymerase III subunit beta [Schlesneria paludicola]|uniref:DNA polymerase III subunit beta n=1 Tax=Schlesneria paludicola TaxID=360056 RepID=UPI00029AD922|nr:DNA polymerase III subunit beta [Schlesneria paludicola]
MQLTCQRNSLTAAFQTVAGVVPSRTPKDILKNVKLQVSGNQATLTGNDSEIGMRCDVPDVQSDSRGEALLPTARVLAVLRELNDDLVQLEITNDATWIRCGYSEFRLSAEDPADFPPVATFEDTDYFVVPAAALRTMIRRTIFATDSESTRYALGGIQMELGLDKVTLAATDSRRLAVVTAASSVVGNPAIPATSPVIPSKAMGLIEKSLGDGTGEVHIALHQNDIVVRCQGTTIASQLVQGRFPDYRKVVPETCNTTIDLVVAPFYTAVRQAMIVTNEESRGVDFVFGKGNLKLQSKATDIGASTIEMPIAYDGPEMTITFDPRYVAEFLKVLDSSSTFHLNLISHDDRATMVTDDHYTYVVMPLARD